MSRESAPRPSRPPVQRWRAAPSFSGVHRTAPAAPASRRVCEGAAGSPASDASPPPPDRSPADRRGTDGASSTSWSSFCTRGFKQIEDGHDPRGLVRLERRRATVRRPETPPRSGASRSPPRRRADVLLVEPVELLGLKTALPPLMPSSAKRRDQLVAREHFAIAARRPAEQREKVDHRFRQVALALVLHHRRRAVALAQPLLVGPRISGTCANCGARLPNAW